MPAIGLTDHGSHGAARSSCTARRASAASSRSSAARSTWSTTSRARRRRATSERDAPHAAGRDDRGLPQPHQALHAGYLEGYYYKPRIDYELIARLHRRHHRALGLPGRACLPGAAARRRAARRAPSSTAWCRSSAATTSTSSSRTPASTSSRSVNPGLLRAGRASAGLPLVGTGDVHYLRAEDADPHEALLCIQTNDLLSNPNRFRFSTRSSTSRPPDEMARLMRRGGDDLLSPTIEIAERCNVELRSEHPPAALRRGDGRLDGMLRRLCERGPAPLATATRRRARCATASSSSSRHRADGLPRLLPDRLGLHRLRQAQRRPVGPGRGSAAGSLVAYALRITDLDPMRYDLLFERFLNPGRKSMPDIDIDFSVHGRERGHRLRDRQVRPRARGADHHLLQAGRQGRRCATPAA